MALEALRGLLGKMDSRESDFQMRERAFQKLEPIYVIDSFLNGQVFEATLRGQGIKRPIDSDDLNRQVQQVARYLPKEVTGIRVPGSEPIEIKRHDHDNSSPQIVWALIDLELHAAGLARQIGFKRDTIVRP